MTLPNATHGDYVVGIVGTGAMGRGIAQICAQAGLSVKLFDVVSGAAEAARQSVAGTFGMLADKGRMTAGEAAAATARMSAVGDLAALADAAVVVEAIVERLDAKQGLFRDLEAIVAPEAILATNTSSLSVTAIGAGCARPERVAGFHFFNPVPLMKVVEVVRGLRTAPEVLEFLHALGRRCGHQTVATQDTPGFLVNHAGRGLHTEGLRILQEGVADTVTIDRVMREAAGFRMGPFELLDLTGLDVSGPVMEQIYGQFYQEPRFRPAPVVAQRIAGGMLGRKTGEGWYRYEGGQKQEPAEAPAAADAAAATVWIGRAEPDLADRLRALLAEAGVALDAGDRPGAASLCLVTPVGTDATTAALREGLDPTRTLAVDMLFDLSKRLTVMATPATAPAMREAARAVLAATGRAVSLVNDSAGFIAQRIVAMIVNIGSDIAQQRIATPEDIDLAVRLGLGYPKGPLGLGDMLGAATVLRILEEMQAVYGDPRYRPSPWLRRRAQLGLSLLTPE